LIDLDLGDPPKRKLAAQRYRILALSGGGYRGLFTARVLAKIENDNNCKLNEVFDLISGTSIGGIIAIALTMGIKAKTIADCIENHGSSIFPANILNKSARIFRTKYSNIELRKSIETILGKPNTKLRLNEIEKSILITAVSHTSSSPRLLRSKGLANREASSEYLIDAALATSAAPTYFPPHKINGDTLIDGGLIANAPDLISLIEAIRFTGRNLSEFQMLSIGTISPISGNSAIDTQKSAGIIQWFTARNIFDTTLAAQERLAISQTLALLNSNYLRIDPKPSNNNSKDIGLDTASQKATDTLNLFSDTALTNLNKVEKTFLSTIIS